MSERITEYNFNMMSHQHQTEQQELTEKIQKLKEKLAVKQETSDNTEKWIALIKEYVDPEELTEELLNTLIEKIVIHEAVKEKGAIRQQKIDIYYRFVGKIE